MWQLGWPIGKMPPFDQNWSSLSQALHTSLSIGIWQRSAFHWRKWQQINQMDKRDVILSDQAACRYDENNKYSLLYSSCHHQSPIIFTKIGFQNLCQIELYQSSVTVFHKQATNPKWKENTGVVENLRGGRTPTTDVVGTAVGRLLADSSSWALCFPSRLHLKYVQRQMCGGIKT